MHLPLGLQNSSLKKGMCAIPNVTSHSAIFCTLGFHTFSYIEIMAGIIWLISSSNRAGLFDQFAQYMPTI